MTDDTNISMAIDMMLEANRDHGVRWSITVEDSGQWAAKVTIGENNKVFESDYFDRMTVEIRDWVEAECDARDQAKYDAAGLNEEPAA